jgi:hypothetical protein
LLTQGEVLDRELAVTAAEEREQPKQVEHESDHRAGSVNRSMTCLTAEGLAKDKARLTLWCQRVNRAGAPGSRPRNGCVDKVDGDRKQAAIVL